ncbi:transcription factor-like 5 protein isoform X2 [Clupea harengus]|uniref:Transcription factor-like 5 protein isoform X2 n=1 Tax=Clupea harengus TaxID=7950 RepID=A0A6P8FF32_CLUHA|nr:transcription factor-like 5 protein isoform X2 [Clupea harengus]
MSLIYPYLSVRMTTSVACKALHASPSGQYISDPVSVIVSQNGCVSNEQGQVLSSEFSLLEMTEVEYSHLQHIIQSHMEAQAGEQEASSEIRTNSAVYSEDRASSHQHSEPDYTANSPPSSPSACQTDTQSSSDVRYTISGISQEGDMDIQDIKMVLISDPSDNVSTGERTPTSCGEVPGSVLAKVRCAMEASRDRVETCDNKSGPVLESRPNPSARVRLEKRFNCSPCDVSRQQDSQSAALNTLLTMLQHSTETTGIAMHSQTDKWIKSDQNPTIECPYPYGGSFFNAVGTTRSQGLGGLSHMHEGNKHSELIIPKNFTFSYRHERGTDATAKAPCFVHTDASEAQVCVKAENVTERKPYNLKRARTRGSRVQVPGIIQHSADPRVVAPGKPGRRTGPPMETTQRRERHNSKERDRRRRIRVCCDELNLLVPFCSSETDKATTLQWTTAFLKYIREVYGDSLKQEFQSTFCGKTGVRIKPSAATTGLHTHLVDTEAEPHSAPSHE